MTVSYRRCGVKVLETVSHHNCVEKNNVAGIYSLNQTLLAPKMTYWSRCSCDSCLLLCVCEWVREGCIGQVLESSRISLLSSVFDGSSGFYLKSISSRCYQEVGQKVDERLASLLSNIGLFSTFVQNLPDSITTSINSCLVGNLRAHLYSDILKWEVKGPFEKAVDFLIKICLNLASCCWAGEDDTINNAPSSPAFTLGTIGLFIICCKKLLFCTNYYSGLVSFLL